MTGQGGLPPHDSGATQEDGKYGKGPYVGGLRMPGSIGVPAFSTMQATLRLVSTQTGP